MNASKDLNKYKKKFKEINLNKIKSWIRTQLNQYKRVLRRAKKPGMQEFLDVVKITGVGLLVIGVLGFIVQTIFLNIVAL